MHILIVRNNSNPQAIDASLLLTAYCASQSIESTVVDAMELFHTINDDDRDDVGLAETEDGLSGHAASPVNGTTASKAATAGESPVTQTTGEHSPSPTTSSRTAPSPKAQAEAAVAEKGPVQLAVALGGDGTLLHAAHMLENSQAPILGINFGHLGFLANRGDDGVVAILAAALAGDVIEERRTNLSIEVVCEGERDPYDGTILPLSERNAAHESHQRFLGFPATTKRKFFALNEIAITRGALGRMITFSIDISGAPMATIRGDGLVVATATGSTAYALSVGGPLVTPDFSGLIVVPIAPHSLQSRAILTGSNDVVQVNLSSNPADREATLFVDGEILSFAHPVRRIYIKRGDTYTTLLRYKAESFYEHAAKVFF